MIERILEWLWHAPQLETITYGYQPITDNGVNHPPKGSGIPLCRSVLPESHLSIPMPPVVKPLRQVCKHCGR